MNAHRRGQLALARCPGVSIMLKQRKRLTIWKELGQGDQMSKDNYGWVDSLRGTRIDYRLLHDGDSEYVNSMPFGHHQLPLFQ